MRPILVPLLLLALAVPCAAEPTKAPDQRIYRWTDEQGAVHMTDDPNALPTGRTADSIQMPKSTGRLQRQTSGADRLRRECAAAAVIAGVIGQQTGRVEPLTPRQRARCDELEREEVRRQMR
jgi:hypothetical protein